MSRQRKPRYELVGESRFGKAWLDSESGELYYHPRPDARGKETLIIRRIDPDGTVTNEDWEFEIGEDYENAWGMRFKLIPPGVFMMGSSEGEGRSDEYPQHEVEITRPFYLQETPVTQGQWEAVMGTNPSHFKDGSPDCPVEKVSYDDSQEFIRRLNDREGVDYYYRLPTEAEWEYACRSGGKDEEYAGGDHIDDVAWHVFNSGSRTHPVKQKVPNGLGLYDMLGNVWEWVADWWDGNYYANSPRNDPEGPPTGASRVVRGGCWYSDPASVRSAFRGGVAPGYRSNLFGFRLARTYP